MQFRSSSMSKSSFSQWVDKRQNDVEAGEDPEESSSLLSQFSSFQDNLSNQMLQLTGTQAESGPLSVGLKNRLTYAMYLLLGATLFIFLAIFVGLPTLIVRPSKFVLCISLATSMAFASIIVLQKPEVFLANLFNSGAERIVTVVALATSLVVTIYVTVFIHSYILTISCGVLQVACIIWFVASFIPGGSKGLWMMLKAGHTFVMTMLTPLIFVCKKSCRSLIASFTS